MADAEPEVEARRSGAGSQQLLCPFDLQMWAVDGMLNFEIVDDPIYEGLELQVFDDPAHGTGMIVLLKRRQDGRLDIYRQPGLTLGPQACRWAVSWAPGSRPTSTRPGSTSATTGSTSTSAFADLAGRVVQVCIDEAATAGGGHRGTLGVAPVGSVIERPVSLPLFVIGRLRPGPPRQAGSSRSASTTTRSRPGAFRGPGCTAAGLVKYTADPTVVVGQPGPPRTHRHRTARRPHGGVEVDPWSHRVARLRAERAAATQPTSGSNPALPGS